MIGPTPPLPPGRDFHIFGQPEKPEVEVYSFHINFGIVTAPKGHAQEGQQKMISEVTDATDPDPRKHIRGAFNKLIVLNKTAPVPALDRQVQIRNFFHDIADALYQQALTRMNAAEREAPP